MKKSLRPYVLLGLLMPAVVYLLMTAWFYRRPVFSNTYGWNYGVPLLFSWFRPVRFYLENEEIAYFDRVIKSVVVLPEVGDRQRVFLIGSSPNMEVELQYGRDDVRTLEIKPGCVYVIYPDRVELAGHVEGARFDRVFDEVYAEPKRSVSASELVRRMAE